MKIHQEPKFQPITITLETAEEARAFWAMVDGVKALDTNTLRAQLGSWFTSQAQLGRHAMTDNIAQGAGDL